MYIYVCLTFFVVGILATLYYWFFFHLISTLVYAVSLLAGEEDSPSIPLLGPPDQLGLIFSLVDSFFKGWVDRSSLLRFMRLCNLDILTYIARTFMHRNLAYLY